LSLKICARYAAVASLAVLPVLSGACKGQTLDAGHDNRPDALPDACATPDIGAPGCTPTGLLDNLVGYWRLDDGTGSTVAFDSSGRGNQGTLHGLDANTAWVAGRSQGALAISHTGWVQVAASTSIDSISDQVTLAAWVDIEGSITTSDLFATAISRQTGTGKDQHYHLSVDLAGRPTLFITTDVGYVMPQSAASVPTGTWVHLAGVYDGAMAHIYVNGVEADSKALTGLFVADTTPIILGGNGNDASGVPTELVPGRIDELMLYARALSAGEIAQLAAGALFPASARDAGGD
jgi:hypothetical protein